jgi:hypothetical protein
MNTIDTAIRDSDDSTAWFRAQQRMIAAGHRGAALAWLERVGDWPSSDPDVAALTRAARRVMGW